MNDGSNRWSPSRFQVASPELAAWLEAKLGDRGPEPGVHSELEARDILLDDWQASMRYALGGYLDQQLAEISPHVLLSHDQQIDGILFEGLMSEGFETSSIVEARAALADGKAGETTVRALRSLYLNLPIIELAGRVAARLGASHAAWTALAIHRLLPRIIAELGAAFGVDVRPISLEILAWSRIAAGESVASDDQLASFRLEATVAWDNLLQVAKPESVEYAKPNAGGRPRQSEEVLLELLYEFEASGLNQAEFSREKCKRFGDGYSRGSLSAKLKKAKQIRESSENVRKTDSS